MITGKSTWTFSSYPVIVSSGVVVGKEEAVSNLNGHYDEAIKDMFVGEDSYERAQESLLTKAIDYTIKKSSIKKKDIQFFISGDLINQITPTTFAAKKLNIPYFGLYSACATSTEGLALASMMLEQNGADYILTGTASHYAAAERQFRFPNEYGGQIPPTAQRTVTGAGIVLLGKEKQGLAITSATIGKVMDYEVTDPFNMGAAMAPAAVDTICQHFQDRQIDASYYDMIVTGDLGAVGRALTEDLLKKHHITFQSNQFIDCGDFLYKKEQNMQAGGSGAACSSVVTYGYFLEQMKANKINKLLFVATGALHSPLTVQQKRTIPSIAHAVSIERK